MILLISDRRAISAKIEEDLAREGFEIEVVKDFTQALLLLNQESGFQIILLDFEYSKHDVYEVCQKLKTNPSLKSIPLVCILEKNRMLDQLLSFEMGADDFIFLPYTTLEIQLKLRSIQRMIELQNQLQQKEAQVENLKNIQRVMVTLNHYINNALTPLYVSIQMMDEEQSNNDDGQLKEIARDTVEFISKVLQSLQKLVQSGKMKIMKEGVYKDMLIDIEHELNRLLEKTQ